VEERLVELENILGGIFRETFLSCAITSYSPEWLTKPEPSRH
jgi:hypothetical protein